MASNDGEISDLYPPPPPYFEFFTKENISRVNDWIKTRQDLKNNKKVEEEEEEEEVSEDTKVENNNITEYPNNELQFLLPPSPPEGPTYQLFGVTWFFKDKMAGLKEMQVTQLYDEDVKENKEELKEDVNSSLKRIEGLKKLFKSLLLNFLELIGIMSKNPTIYLEKLEQIRIIIINIHHLLNEYRPHQARESLILMLQNQVNITKNEIEKIDNGKRQVMEKLPKIINDIINDKKNDNKLLDNNQIETDKVEKKIDRDNNNNSNNNNSIENLKTQALTDLIENLNI